jgi:hypothetical protein
MNKGFQKNQKNNLDRNKNKITRNKCVKNNFLNALK